MGRAWTEVLDAALSPAPRVRYARGLFGFVLGILRLVATVAGPHIARALKPPDPPPQKLSDTLVEAGDKLIGKLLDRVRGKQPETIRNAPPPTPAIPWGWYLSVAATSLGMPGALAGTGAGVRRENHRLAASAIVTGSLAVAWTYIVAALVIALAIFFLLLLFGAMGGKSSILQPHIRSIRGKASTAWNRHPPSSSRPFAGTSGGPDFITTTSCSQSVLAGMAGAYCSRATVRPSSSRPSSGTLSRPQAA